MSWNEYEGLSPAQCQAFDERTTIAESRAREKELLKLRDAIRAFQTVTESLDYRVLTSADDERISKVNELMARIGR